MSLRAYQLGDDSVSEVSQGDLVFDATGEPVTFVRAYAPSGEGAHGGRVYIDRGRGEVPAIAEGVGLYVEQAPE